MKIVVLQPSYLGYMGFFGLLDACDVFVVYDDVQFEHQSWQHRNKIKNNDGWMWLTVPIIRREGQLINEVMIDNSKHWREDHWKSVEQNYGKSPYFKQYRDVYWTLYQADWGRLVDLNLVLIQSLSASLGIIQPTMILSSDIETSGSKTDRLIPLLRAVKATSFIEGMAGKAYLDVKKMNDNGIEVLWFDYQHPTYPQNGSEFIIYLSALDLLFNTGERAIDYIRRGVNLVGESHKDMLIRREENK